MVFKQIHSTLKQFVPEMFHRYLAPTEILGVAALLVFIFGRVFNAATSDKVEKGEASVLVQAIPFAATFITIILIFILLIFIVAIRFNGKMPYRTYRPIELLIMGGIAGGVFALFQPWEIVSYRYGFLLLLISTISFILWSHVTPQTAKSGENLPSFTSLHHIVGVGVGVMILIATVTLVFSTFEEPKEPYGESERRWGFMRDEQKTAIAANAQHDYDYTRYSIFAMLLLPAAAGYFIGREVAAVVVESPESINPLTLDTAHPTPQ